MGEQGLVGDGDGDGDGDGEQGLDGDGDGEQGVWANAVCSWSPRLLPHVTTSSAATLLCLHQLCQKQHVTF